MTLWGESEEDVARELPAREKGRKKGVSDLDPLERGRNKCRPQGEK